MMRSLWLRYHRWRIFRESPGSPARIKAVRRYMGWQYAARSGRTGADRTRYARIAHYLKGGHA